MRRYVGTTLLVLLISVWGSIAVAADKYDGWIFYSGDELYRTCKSGDPADQQTRTAYVCGTMDAWTARYILTGKKLYPICLPTLPGTTTCARLADIVTKDLDEHPDLRKSVPAGAIGSALQQAYPCKG